MSRRANHFARGWDCAGFFIAVFFLLPTSSWIRDAFRPEPNTADRTFSCESRSHNAEYTYTSSKCSRHFGRKKSPGMVALRSRKPTDLERISGTRLQALQGTTDNYELWRHQRQGHDSPDEASESPLECIHTSKMIHSESVCC